MTRLWLIAIFAGSFAASLAATLPLGFALSLAHANATGLSAETASGSIWDGRLGTASVHGVSFGDMQASLDPLALLSGGARLRLQSMRGSAVLVQGGTRGVEHATADIETQALRVQLPIEGALRLRDATVLFVGERCSRAGGGIATDILRVWNGPELTGEFACDAEGAVAHLTGRASGLDVDVAVRIGADGRYRLVTRIVGGDAALQGLLLSAGFKREGDAMLRSDEGVLGT